MLNNSPRLSLADRLLLRKRDRLGARGSALLVTLAFVLLLSVVILAFLSHALLEQQISTSSANQIKADIFARGVEATLIGDLQGEMANNSVAGYLPKVPANMVPAYDLNGAAGGSANFANLLKVSNPAPVAPMPTASGIPTTTASINNRAFSVAQWYGAAGPQLVDPNAAPPVPQWVLVARDGSNPAAFVPATTPASTTTYSPGKPALASTVTGRFAYAIYDEGGLIDVNTAGAPSKLVPTSSSYPIGEGDADLTQLVSPAGGTAMALTAAQADQIIAYRNYATLGGGVGGTLAAPVAIPAANALAYFSSLLGNPLGFLNTNNTGMVKVGGIYYSDQRFTSRQQLIQFMTTLTAGSAGQLATLQYLTHFSRDLDQPSYVSPVTDPRVAGAPLVVGNGAAGGNTANGSDAKFNPSFLATSVKTAFTRNDGSAANIGDPLVKTRFNLNRLAWITYKGPLCDGHLGNGVATQKSDINSDKDLQAMAGYLHDNYGLSWAFLQQGTAANIYNYFGLSWVNDIRTALGFYTGDNQLKWVYNHQAVAKPVGLPLGSGQILYLTSINGSGAIAREPDFFELLKAAIACGSKAKAAVLVTPGPPGPSPAQLVDNVNNSTDSSLDNAIVQIGANIIDQVKLDGYPSRILFSDGSMPIVLKELRGTESLPYIYNFRYAEVQAVQPFCSTPSLPTGYPRGINTPGHVAQPVNLANNGVGGTISTTVQSGTVPLCGGTGAVFSLLIPEIWNPSDPNSPRCAPVGANLFPTSFRLVVESTDPDHIVPCASPTITKPSYSDVDNASDAKNTTTPPALGDLVSYTPNSTAGNLSLYSNISIPTLYNTFPANTSSTHPAAALGPVPSVAQSQPPGTGLFTQITDITVGCGSFPFTAESTAMVFNDPATTELPTYFHEPTLLANPGVPVGLTVAGTENVLNTIGANVAAGKITIPNTIGGPNIQSLIKAAMLNNAIPSTQTPGPSPSFIGIFTSVMPCIWYAQAGSIQPSGPLAGMYGADAPPNNLVISQPGAYRPNPPAVTFRMQYEYPIGSGIWRTYDDKYSNIGEYASGFQRNTIQDGAGGGTLSNKPTAPFGAYQQELNDPYNYSSLAVAYDPRTSRFGMVCYKANYPNGTPFVPIPSGAVTPPTPKTWVSQPDNTVESMSPGAVGATTTFVSGGAIVSTHYAQTVGFVGGAKVTQLGYFSQNLFANGVYYQDPDGIVRRASGAAAAGTTGLPMALLSSAGNQTQSRPIILHRPFRSVGELGYVFSGTPWKNLDFENSESGDSALLDVFAVGEPTGPSAVVAGKVNLNTQQIPVLQAILAGNYKDEQTNYTAAPAVSLPALSAAEATSIATALTTRTIQTNLAAGMGPLENVSELVGRYVAGVSNGNKQPFAGFSDDIVAGTFKANAASSVAIQRFKESAIRGLAASGQTRVWNLLIDLVAQTGRYPASAANAAQFNVEGQQRYWIHLAIDRLTGQVIDKQVEVVKE